MVSHYAQRTRWDAWLSHRTLDVSFGLAQGETMVSPYAMKLRLGCLVVPSDYRTCHLDALRGNIISTMLLKN